MDRPVPWNLPSQTVAEIMRSNRRHWLELQCWCCLFFVLMRHERTLKRLVSHQIRHFPHIRVLAWSPQPSKAQRRLPAKPRCIRFLTFANQDLESITFDRERLHCLSQQLNAQSPHESALASPSQRIHQHWASGGLACRGPSTATLAWMDGTGHQLVDLCTMHGTGIQSLGQAAR